MDHSNIDILGDVIKAARLEKGLTREQLSELMHISPRYLMSIENENKKPSYDVLFRLVRELGISTDLIFYPERKRKGHELDDLINFLYLCDEYQISVLKATLHGVKPISAGYEGFAQ